MRWFHSMWWPWKKKKRRNGESRRRKGREGHAKVAPRNWLSLHEAPVKGSGVSFGGLRSANYSPIGCRAESDDKEIAGSAIVRSEWSATEQGISRSRPPLLPCLLRGGTRFCFIGLAASLLSSLSSKSHSTRPSLCPTGLAPWHICHSCFNRILTVSWRSFSIFLPSSDNNATCQMIFISTVMLELVVLKNTASCTSDFDEGSRM